MATRNPETLHLGALLADRVLLPAIPATTAVTQVLALAADIRIEGDLTAIHLDGAELEVVDALLLDGRGDFVAAVFGCSAVEGLAFGEIAVRSDFEDPGVGEVEEGCEAEDGCKQLYIFGDLLRRNRFSLSPVRAGLSYFVL
ncbi:uncharacterized protein EI97DRAFT_435023 [Westerdykella ornata]|uniref:Uncharacterized protein n=1 Tax=Westerdykella ornata TaxID=318751 RepID=A0A6A6JFS2_WESOR|nr:uncharacterized protein EI97DRAFT_435023 [Westerdykella ornata]KAF2274476.1 hypothetical protein EI97DRAFT_435023 [Westerdykella ornata]